MGNRVLRDRTIPNVYGVGYMGNNFELKSSYNGKKCPIYYAWVRMFERCYSKKLHESFPTYIGCTVSDEFKDYSKWRVWYDNYPYKQDGWQLDKDLLIKGNKVYSESTCVFLPQEINAVLTKRTASRGEYLIGVCWSKTANAFKAQVRKSKGKQKNLGYFATEIEAFNAYKTAKESFVKEQANKFKSQIDERAYEALMNYTVEIDD